MSVTVSTLLYNVSYCDIRQVMTVMGIHNFFPTSLDGSSIMNHTGPDHMLDGIMTHSALGFTPDV